MNGFCCASGKIIVTFFGFWNRKRFHTFSITEPEIKQWLPKKLLYPIIITIIFYVT